jgi:hypothetical protein
MRGYRPVTVLSVPGDELLGPPNTALQPRAIGANQVQRAEANEPGQPDLQSEGTSAWLEWLIMLA